MGTTLVTPNAIEDPRGEAGGLAEAGVLRVEIDVPISRVLKERVMTGLDSVKLNQVMVKYHAYPAMQTGGRVVEGWFRWLTLRELSMVGIYMG